MRNFSIRYARESLRPMPEPWLFLAGPTPRNLETQGWRNDALEEIDRFHFEGTILLPEDEDFGSFNEEVMDKQVEWEWDALEAAHCILFWVPRNMETMPALTTNVEFGMYADSGKCILGLPPEGVNNGYLERVAVRFHVPIARTLRGTVSLAVIRAEQRLRR